MYASKSFNDWRRVHDCARWIRGAGGWHDKKKLKLILRRSMMMIIDWWYCNKIKKSECFVVRSEIRDRFIKINYIFFCMEIDWWWWSFEQIFFELIYYFLIKLKKSRVFMINWSRCKISRTSWYTLRLMLRLVLINVFNGWLFFDKCCIVDGILEAKNSIINKKNSF